VPGAGCRVLGAVHGDSCVATRAWCFVLRCLALDTKKMSVLS
jgi:hypothetical protein